MLDIRVSHLTAVVFCMPLAACFTPGPPSSSGAGSASTTVADVINQTKKFCQFEPTVETVANILAVASPELGAAEAVAKAICNAVNPPAGTVKGLPTVAGVTIHGHPI